MLAVIPLKTKDPVVVARALKGVLAEIGEPVAIMVDSGSEFHKEFAEEVKNEGIKLIVTKSSAVFAERVIRTINQEIQKRKDALGVDNWTNVLPDVLQKYNSSVRVSTGKTPVDAQKYNNRAEVHDHLEGRAKHNRKYSEIESLGSQASSVNSSMTSIVGPR